MQRLLNMPSSSISGIIDDKILNAKNEGDRILQTAMQTLQLKVLSMKDPSKQAMINKKLNDLKLLVSKINEASKQKHDEIDQKFDEMQLMLDEEVKKQKLKMIKRTSSVSSIFQFGSLNWRITVSNNNNNNDEELTESMENTISEVGKNYINQNNVDNDDGYDLNKIFCEIEEDGEIEPEPDFGYDHCNNWMCYQCQYINPVTFENLIHSNRKCKNCASNGWPTKREMAQMIKDSNTRYGEYFKKIMQ